MKFKILVIVAFCTIMVACNSNENNVVNRVELPGTIDENAFADNVESISVMNLEMDDDWVFSDYSYTELTDNYLYMLDQSQLRLKCFDLHTGNKISSRIIKGNGPGEITSVSSTFCIGDTLCVYNFNGINRYDHNCRFLGKIQEFRMLGTSDYSLIRQKCGNFAFIPHDNYLCDTADATLILTDKSFNVLSRHFAVPHFNVATWGAPEPYYVNNDTIRFFLKYDNHLYTLRGDMEECTELVVPNPLTPQTEYEIFKTGEYSRSDNYDGNFYGLCESGNFLVFKYSIDKQPFTAMLDKRARHVVSIPSETASPASVSAIINCFFNNTWLIKTDGRFIYVGIANHYLSEIFEADEKFLDARLRKTLAEYRAHLERNAEYIKGLDSDECDKATIILKIKLKD